MEIKHERNEKAATPRANLRRSTEYRDSNVEHYERCSTTDCLVAQQCTDRRECCEYVVWRCASGLGSKAFQRNRFVARRDFFGGVIHIVANSESRTCLLHKNTECGPVMVRWILSTR
jgi:hypothetical protein